MLANALFHQIVNEQGEWNFAYVPKPKTRQNVHAYTTCLGKMHSIMLQA